MTDSIVAVLDTNVVSSLFRNDSHAAEYRRLVRNKILIVSFQTVAETALWARIRNWGPERKQHFEEFMRAFEVHEYTSELADHWAYLTYERRIAGRQFDPADAWIGATASLLRAPLVTHNVKDFEGLTGVTILTALRREQA